MRECVLAALNINNQERFEISLGEMKALAEAADLHVAETFTQNLPKVNTGYYIGSGKIEEIRAYLEMTGIDLVLFDNQLTPMQLSNLSEALDAEVLDRTAVILQIFADRARTREANLQVEYARLQYLLPRLVGMHSDLGRQGGASGAMSNKGSGEKKIELDRRHIEHRMAELRRELEAVDRERETQRAKRMRSGMPRIALVGYTNAGKSTIMNEMLKISGGVDDKMVYEENMLFATLDTTVRRIDATGDHKPFLLSDTVGFIDNLPTTLVKAFRSTLAETKYADVLLLVSDISDPEYRDQLEVTIKTLEETGAGSIPRLYVFNKADQAEGFRSDAVSVRNMSPDDRRITISAKNPDDIRRLMEAIVERINENRISCELLIPYTDGNVLNRLMKSFELSVLDYTATGTRISAVLTQEEFKRCAEYII
ncbi:MAG: GTPase HflX [Lachnospiraceae bacterium]|nr:GTPase HflX [Lachnospiraceae bacterium]